MGFSAVNPVKDKLIITPDFMPQLSVKDFAESMKLDGTVTPERMSFALQDAVNDICRELKAWVTEQINQTGLLTLSEYDEVNKTMHCFSFKKAVFNHAKAALTEHYRDYDTGRDAAARSKELTPQIDTCRRNMRNAIADIIGRPHCTIELI